MLGGAIVGMLFMFGPAAGTAAAHCLGYCADLEGYTYAGCSIHVGTDDKVDVVICAYIGMVPEVN